jgi:hypothetical protein
MTLLGICIGVIYVDTGLGEKCEHKDVIGGGELTCRCYGAVVHCRRACEHDNKDKLDGAGRLLVGVY